MHVDPWWNDSWESRLNVDEVKGGFRVFFCCFLKGSDFALAGSRVARVCANLNKLFMGIVIPDQEIDFVPSLMRT
jgi:hypothetical protein